MRGQNWLILFFEAKCQDSQEAFLWFQTLCHFAAERAGNPHKWFFGPRSETLFSQIHLKDPKRLPFPWTVPGFDYCSVPGKLLSLETFGFQNWPTAWLKPNCSLFCPPVLSLRLCPHLFLNCFVHMVPFFRCLYTGHMVHMVLFMYHWRPAI